MFLKCLVLLFTIWEVAAKVSVEDYYKQPDLFHLDNYPKCMGLKRNTLYCYTTMQLSPINPTNASEVWKIIEEVIKSPINYRHDRIRHGICIPETCSEIPESEYALGATTPRFRVAVGDCYKERLEKYGVKGEVAEIHCENENPFYEIDNLDRAYAIVIFVLLSLVVLGTISNNLNYDVPFLEAFSISKNWQRLTRKNPSPEVRQLLVIQGIRVYNTLPVIMCHTAMINLLGPILNWTFMENVHFKPLYIFLTNGGLICQTFYIISGWIMAYNFCALTQNKQIKFRDLALALLQRFLRLAPLLLFVIGFSATWLRHFGKGPFYEHAAGNEFRNCRKNWYWNLLFLNNYVDNDKMCLQQSWFLSGDMQAFILGLFIMAAVLKYPKYTNKIFATVIVIPMLVTFFEHKYKELDAFSKSYPEYLYTTFLESREWLTIYSQGHHHFPSYFQGLICGFYLYKFQREHRQFTINKFWTVIWWIFIWGVPIGTVVYPYYYFCEDCEYSSFHASFYQAVSKYLFSMPLSIAMLGMMYGIGGPMISAVTWAPVETLAKITFSVYLTHPAFMRVYKGSFVYMPYMSDYVVLRDTICDIIMSFAYGTVICLIIEMPTSALQKLIFGPRENTKKIAVNGKNK